MSKMRFRSAAEVVSVPDSRQILAQRLQPRTIRVADGEGFSRSRPCMLLLNHFDDAHGLHLLLDPNLEY
jgi:hypothetical protein